MYSSLLDLVRELNTLNDDNLADRVITNGDVQWCLSELQDILEAEQPTLTPPNEAPPCYQPDGDGCAYQCYDGQDEPIEKCKACPLCYSDKQRHYTTPNEWVSVDERLPEPTYCVLVYTTDYSIEVDARGSDGEWMSYEVTHWMPLPAPPGKEDQQ